MRSDSAGEKPAAEVRRFGTSVKEREKAAVMDAADPVPGSGHMSGIATIRGLEESVPKKSPD